jgi:hypothetical protein
LILYGGSHGSNPGWVRVGLSNAGARFAVNDSGIGTGGDVFSVTSAGAVTAAVSYAVGAAVGISGTFAPPASITVTGGIITAAS